MENTTAIELRGLRPSRTLDGLDACLFTHAKPSQADKVTVLCARDNLGAVYTLNRPAADQVHDLVRRHSRAGLDTTTMLVDAGLYAGKGRRPGTAPLDESWIIAQRQAGLRWALTNSGYVGEGDYEALAHILGEAGRFHRPVIAVLGLHNTWLTKRSDELRAAVDRSTVPVALMVEHRDDPFAARSAVAGLVHGLASDTPTLLLRSDISAIGALAYGAAAGAVGTTTSLRHFYPVSTGGGGHQVRPAAVVPRGLIYRQLDKIAEAHRLDPDGEHWRCGCITCAGRPLNWLIHETDAFEHSVMALATITAGILSLPTLPDRRKSWIETCQAAQVVDLEIEGQTGLDWPTPKFLGSWVALRS